MPSMNARAIARNIIPVQQHRQLHLHINNTRSYIILLWIPLHCSPHGILGQDVIPLIAKGGASVHDAASSQGASVIQAVGTKLGQFSGRGLEDVIR